MSRRAGMWPPNLPEADPHTYLSSHTTASGRRARWRSEASLTWGRDHGRSSGRIMAFRPLGPYALWRKTQIRDPKPHRVHAHHNHSSEPAENFFHSQ